MDELVELEFVDLACVEPREAVADALEQLAQLCLVVAGDEVPRGSSFCLLGCLAVPVFSHSRTVRQMNGGPQVARRLLGASLSRERLGSEAEMDDEYRPYPWVTAPDDRFTLALVTDVAEVLVRHGYPPPAGAVLVELTAGLFRALHAGPF